jgi:hypothetical protein
MVLFERHSKKRDPERNPSANHGKEYSFQAARTSVQFLVAKRLVFAGRYKSQKPCIWKE